MSPLQMKRSSVALRALVAIAVSLLLVARCPAEGSARTCTNRTLYAITGLNLRHEPSLDAAVLRFIPTGPPVHHTSGAAIDGYAPVTSDGVSGWAVALGLVGALEEVAAAAAPGALAPAPAPAATSETRFTQGGRGSVIG